MTWPASAGVDPGDVAPPQSDPLTVHAMAQVTARLQRRYPTASAALVQRCVDVATAHYEHPAIEHFVPILVERMADDALRHAVHCRPVPVDPAR